MNLKERIVRIFISSTFLDMQAERELLVKQVFPRLRKLCEQRAVTWAEVDLRWGITDEAKAEGKVLPMCLYEISRCQPYFIGLLGERYGWVPDEIPIELLNQQSWLAEHKYCSVTEMEILHGVLNNPAMANQAFFYFRDPEYLDRFETAEKANFIEIAHQDEISKFGILQAEDRAGKRQSRLISLKNRIRNSGLPVRENYCNPKTLGELVFLDIKEVIDRLFPEKEIVDVFDREKWEQASFARSRLEPDVHPEIITDAYFGHKKYFERLDGHIRDNNNPLVVLGESGAGKTALLANWIRSQDAAQEVTPSLSKLLQKQKLIFWRKPLSTASKRPLIIYHFIGSTPTSMDWAAMLRRIMMEIKRHFQIRDTIPDQPELLLPMFSNWLHLAANRGRVVIVIDALDQLEDKEAAKDMVWLPEKIPDNIRVILSTLPGRSLTALQERGWLDNVLEVKPLTEDERLRFIQVYFKHYGKELASDLVDQITSAPQTTNPLFLKTLMEELRVFSDHMRLSEELERYLVATSIQELYQLVLDRWVSDYEQDRPGMVQEAMSLIWGTRHGLQEAELLDLLGKDGEPLPHIVWLPLYLAAETALVNRAGYLCLGNEYFEKAIERRYFFSLQDEQRIRYRLIDYFDNQDRPLNRRLNELPWQLSKIQNWDRLLQLLSSLDYIGQFISISRRYEFLGYWHNIEKNSQAAINLQLLYQAAIDRYQASGASANDLGLKLEDLSVFFELIGNPKAALKFSNNALEQFKLAHDGESVTVAQSLSGVGFYHLRFGDLEAADSSLKKACAMYESLKVFDHPTYSKAIYFLAKLHEEQGNYRSAGKMIRKAQRLLENMDETDFSLKTAALNNLALIYLDKKKYKKALHLFTKCLKRKKMIHGSTHPETAIVLTNLATCYFHLYDDEKAENFHQQALQIREKFFGEIHECVGRSLINLSDLYLRQSKFLVAEKMMKRALAINERVFGRDHYKLAEVLNGLALVYCVTNKLDSAEKVFHRALIIVENSCGSSMINAAEIRTNLNQLAEIRRRSLKKL